MLRAYYHWLHGRWPAGRPERLPMVGEHGRTRLPGVYIVGDLTRVPLLKFSLASGVAAVREGAPERAARSDAPPVVIIGAGVAGVAAAVECARQGIPYRLLESAQIFHTVVNFPLGKPIYTYPAAMRPPGALQVSGETREELLEQLRFQADDHGVQAEQAVATHITLEGGALQVHRQDAEPVEAAMVIIAIGRSGNFRRLDIPGEDHERVSNRLHDPAKFCGQEVAVVGGGDTACEAAIALATCNKAAGQTAPLVTLIHRGEALTRPKPANRHAVEELVAAGLIDLRLGAVPVRIDEQTLTIHAAGSTATIAAAAIFVLIGREAPLEFFRRSGLPIHGEVRPRRLAFLLVFLGLAALIYAMKNFSLFDTAQWNPVTWARAHIAALPSEHPFGLIDTIIASMSNGIGFFITLLYCAAVIGFGIDRMWRRRTPYVRVQTLTLMAFQCLPLFLLPEIILPYAGHLGWFDEGWLKQTADGLFPAASYDANGREYWRAYGFILAWPLFVWNVFTSAPLWAWLVIGLLQTFVVIPLLVWRWGKGAYCGWICSCGALAETMGDRQREKMPHGPGWNALNMLGQVLLWIALGMLILRVIGWASGGALGDLNGLLLVQGWKPVVDFFLAGALGLGLYFWLSGRMWCRFACPLAALMHIYARFSRFRIVPETEKCISCNACTAVCHQGIDVMNFANKGQHMADPQCVRCSACVQTCPTGVLQFGQVDADGQVIQLDKLRARLSEP